MDTKDLAPLDSGQLAQIKEVAEWQWRDVLTELEKTADPKTLGIIKGIAGHLYVGGYMAGVEHAHEAVRGIK